MTNNVYLIKRPDYYNIWIFKTKDEALQQMTEWEGRDYFDSARVIEEYDLNTKQKKCLGASVEVNGKYKYLSEEELKEWQKQHRPNKI